MIADIVQTGLDVVVGARCSRSSRAWSRSRRRACCRWCPATSRSSRGSGPIDGRDRAAPPARSCCSSPGSRSCSRCSGRSRPRSCPSSRATTGQRVAGLVVIVIGLFMIGLRAAARLDRPVRGATSVPARRCGPGRWAPCRSGWRSPPGGRRASVRSSAGILAIAATQSTVRGVFLLVCYSLGLGVPFLLVGLGVQRFVGAFGWIRRHYAVDRGCVSGGLLIVVGRHAVDRGPSPGSSRRWRGSRPGSEHGRAGRLSGRRP